MNCIRKHKHHNERLVRFFLEKAYSDEDLTLDRLIRDNILSGSNIAELAVSRALGIDLDEDGIGKDLKDDSDVKTATVCEIQIKRGNRVYSTLMAHIKTRNKLGLLRVITFNPYFDIWHFFKIPLKIHKKGNQIWIRFDSQTGHPKGKYKKYQIETWEEFCKK